MAATIQGSFSVNGIPRNDATVKLWSAGAFTSAPSKDDPIPSGSPISSTTTSENSGADGAYRFVSVASGEYYVSIEWNGAVIYDYWNVRDGTEGLGWTLAQDYANLSLAITATPVGNTLYIPQGVYTLTTGLTLTKQINIRGAGAGTILRSGANGIDLLTINNVSGIVLADFTLDNPTAFTTDKGITVSGCGYVTMRNLIVKDLGTGLRFNNCNSIAIEECLTSGSVVAGIHVSGGTKFGFENCFWNNSSPSYDLRAEGSWSIIRVDRANRIYAANGVHLVVTNYSASGSGATLETSGTAEIFNPVASRIYNVRDFGAKGDDSNDDTVSIQSAIDVAKTIGTSNLGTVVYLPAGRYKITSPLVLPRTGSTPTNVVHLHGENIRTTQLSSTTGFPNDRAFVEWPSGSVARTWHQEIRNLTMVLPNVTGCMGIWYKCNNKATAAAILLETLQIHIEDVMIEGNNEFHQVLVYLEGNVKFSTIKNLYGDPSPGAATYDTILLKFDTNDYGTLYGADDRSGLHYSIVEGLYGSPRKGGYVQVFKGRLHYCTFQVSNAGVGCQNSPAYEFTNCSASRIANISNEGRGEKPQIKFTTCSNILVEYATAGSPNDTGFGVGNGIEITGCIELTWRGHNKRLGNPTFAGQSVYNLVVDSSSRRCKFYNFQITGPVSGEVSWGPPASGDCYGEFFDINGTGYYFKGQDKHGMLAIQSSVWDQEHLIMGIYHFWVDNTGVFRIKNSAPTSHNDGTVIGSQT